jgi:hypothetical protein
MLPIQVNLVPSKSSLENSGSRSWMRPTMPSRDPSFGAIE